MSQSVQCFFRYFATKHGSMPRKPCHGVGLVGSERSETVDLVCCCLVFFVDSLFGFPVDSISHTMSLLAILHDRAVWLSLSPVQHVVFLSCCLVSMGSWQLPKMVGYLFGAHVALAILTPRDWCKLDNKCTVVYFGGEHVVILLV
jgi:hypothetical protein